MAVPHIERYKVQLDSDSFSFKQIRMNEDFYEEALIEYFVDNLGYEHLYGPDVLRTSDRYDDVFLPGALEPALRRINKGLPRQAIEEAIRKISNVEGGSLEQRNELFSDYLQAGVEVRFLDNGEERDDIVRLLDFENPDNNDFYVVNQWTYVEYSEKRPDVIVFVNGMPLVIFELKSPSREETDASDAYLQLRNYMHHIPSLFCSQRVLCYERYVRDSRGNHYRRRGSIYGLEIVGRRLLKHPSSHMDDHAGWHVSQRPSARYYPELHLF